MKQNWEYKKLGEVCDFQGGSQPPKEEWIKEAKDGYIRMLQIRDFTQTRSFDIEYVKLSNRLKFCQEDDILIGRYGASVGKILTGLNGAYNVAILKTLPIEELVSKAYIKYFFQSPFFQQFLLSICTQRAAQAGFSKEDIADFPIPLPPLATQSAIVSELDSLSAIIADHKSLLKKYDELEQAIFYDMFGDPVKNEKGWEVKKFSSICINRDRERVPITSSDRVEGSYPYYGASGIVDYVDDYIFDGEFLLISEDGANLLVRHTPIAFSIKGKTWVNNHAHILEFQFRETQLYTEFYINNIDVSSLLTGSAQPKLNQAKLNNLDIPLPPLPLQQQFASKIEAIEAMKADTKKSLEKAEELFNARMDFYFNA